MIGKNKQMLELLKKYGREKVIFVGIDVSKNFHTVAIVDGEYEIILRPTSFGIYESDFRWLTEKIFKVIEERRIKRIVFGCEPSGHYYLNITNKLKEVYPEEMFKLINPKATKSNRDQRMECNKTDPIDTYAIADLLIRGEGYDFTKEDSIYRSINEYVRYLDSLTKEQTRLKNRIHAYLDEIYPGLENKLSNFTKTKYGRALLQILPNPRRLKEMSEEDIERMYKEHGFKIMPKIAKRISEASKELLIFDDFSLEMKLSFLKMLSKQFIHTNEIIAEVEEKLQQLLEKLNYAENILALKCIKTKTLSRVIAYLKNPKRFENSRQVVSFIGLVAQKDQSGKKHGKEKISRQGHKKLRSTLIQAAQLAISNIGYFTAYYNRLVIENRKDPKVAITATANKLIRFIMHMIKTGETFNPPTVDDKEMAKSKINRLTSKKLKELTKNKRMDSLTQDITRLYPIRV